ncbi:unnamed protein product [Bursaphelenchus okinawaensis]|uniref:Phosphatidic acid phosphatase type 2/haloperoxidase domain-containing protein n=1 Tax=Bursaphelenchus okinawaensis TaxID=465554 RepID=A0A811LRX1_9BILA|nr:unnamed protein product [Bursaphelenchus okinawaensis]CAG9127741.1 unnamed protein product [Bursaphelenchus okinawaensis]
MISQHVFSVLVALPFLVVLKYLARLVPYEKQGFFCDDNEIRLPYREDTIGTNTMLVVFGIVAVILMTISEYSLVKHLSKKGKRIVTENNKVHPVILTILFFLICIITNVFCIQTTVGFSKRTVSKLRPNFIAVCQPDLVKLCSNENAHKFINDYKCYGEFREDEYYSFPSGHSAHAVNFGVFMIFYLQRRYKFREPSRAFLQLGLFFITVFICLSRVRDNKHRLSDVMGGAAVGALFAWFFLRHVLYDFRLNRYETVDTERMADKYEGYHKTGYEAV